MEYQGSSLALCPRPGNGQALNHPHVPLHYLRNDVLEHRGASCVAFCATGHHCLHGVLGSQHHFLHHEENA